MRIDHETLTHDEMPDGAAAGMAGHSIAHTYRRLVFGAGLHPREAASLLGRLQGLPMVPGGWTLSEVERLMFVRALVSGGRMGS